MPSVTTQRAGVGAVVVRGLRRARASGVEEEADVFSAQGFKPIMITCNNEGIFRSTYMLGGAVAHSMAFVATVYTCRGFLGGTKGTG